ncbi:P-loop NTPase fold protein [Burkholderia vietnamiensis]|uniref:P-loop NTPase fold protein n=1 Tax=Burkholderia vietnamiensis TaxID=60552 RepID=UPI000ABCA198|nr:P-loop NTPase fold protein [Burkholderia vietnamiensis]MDN7924413.1 hypothetical protein [Burkholderia vietnamiensis]HEP6274172.1 hypothetical protein [Burkholderia vietnamiensis]HEP6282261.1 hypothetical protein [Burkholderia vietnamiensis]HEP6307243.1 hypothetical protein [Burkholderia vietnamiensis]
MTIEFSVGQKALQSLIEEFSVQGELSNEAQTRFSFIDRLLVDVLGWPRSGVAVEVYEDGERSDYECGKPRQLIVEAKRADRSFSIPPRGKKASTKIKLRSLIEFNEATKSGIEQVQKYCSDRGVPAAALCNGPQLIVFLATRLDGKSVMDGDAFVFDSYESMLSNFATIYECLSPAGIEEKRLVYLLGGESAGSLPPKLSALCLNYFAYKYSSEFQENVKNASSIVIEDVGRTSEFEHDFLKECYCESGPLTQYSLLSKNILSTRYSALFSSTDRGSVVEEVNPKKQGDKLREKVLAEALARRPIVLLGDVGVGKTSFIKNLIQVDASSQFERAIFIYFDLGSQGALSSSVRDALLTQIENTLRADHGINLQDLKLLEKVYKSELADFDGGYYSLLKDSNLALFLEKRVEHIRGLVHNRAEHLRKVLSEISREKRCQIIIVIDNSDQRDISVQQDAFVIAHELASTWDALVFLSLRPQTFHASKRSGTVSAYPPKIFVISPPKLEDVIEKRLAFALKIAQGRLPFKARDLSMHVESLAILIKALQKSLRDNPELYEFIINVSSGNVRVAIELITKFIGNPNVNSELIVQIFSEVGEYRIPLHEFAKGGLLGDYAYYQEDASYAYNVFGATYADKREHFLSLVLLGYLSWEGAYRKQPDGFVGIEALQGELQSIGFTIDQIQTHLQKLARKKLVETTERRLLETTADIHEQGMPEAFRLTMLGAYHLKKWAYDFSFLEAMSFDTPVFDETTRGALAEHVNEQSLFARHQRATTFREYLDTVWEGVKPQAYFDWMELRKTGNPSFDRVRKRLSDQGKL